MADLKRGIEIERKYIIRKPRIDELMAMPEYTVSEIEQIYLKTEHSLTHRIRRRECGGVTKCYETKKTRIDRMSVIEDEGEITSEEYADLKAKIDPETRPIYKTRHTFLYDNRTVEIDVYPDWEKTAIMECELESREATPSFPPFLSIVREVTGVKGYSNAAMSKHFPPEDV